MYCLFYIAASTAFVRLFAYPPLILIPFHIYPISIQDPLTIYKALLITDDVSFFDIS